MSVCKYNTNQELIWSLRSVLIEMTRRNMSVKDFESNEKDNIEKMLSSIFQENSNTSSNNSDSTMQDGKMDKQ